MQDTQRSENITILQNYCITAFKAIGAVSVLNHFYGRKVKVWKLETLYAKVLVVGSFFDACDEYF